MTNWIAAVARRLRAGRQQTGWVWTDRQLAYAMNDAYYSGSIYDTLANGGQRENINATLGNAAAADLGNLYNPVQNVVDLYLHVFGGAFGDAIQIVPQGTATPALADAIDRIWQWSNLTIAKQSLCRFAANQGCVGLRIVARNHADLTQRRVYLKVEHPRVIRDAELDDRGNVQAIQLEYDLTTGLAEDSQTITIREELTKDTIATWRVDQGASVPFDLTTMSAGGPRASYPNALGVVPYVILRHTESGDTWGANAWSSARSPIDRLNALLSHIDVQIHRHVKVKWLIAVAGAAPIEIDLSDLSVVYVDTRNQTGTPLMQPLVAPLDLSGAISQAQLQLGIIEDRLPELKATGGKFLSNQSGETIAELRKPAEDKISLARASYEDALIRAQQIAVSWMVLLGMADVGTGTGDRAAADRAFQEGFEDHRFNTRPLLSVAPPAAPAAAAAPPMEPPPMPLNGKSQAAAS